MGWFMIDLASSNLVAAPVGVARVQKFPSDTHQIFEAAGCQDGRQQRKKLIEAPLTDAYKQSVCMCCTVL